MDDRSKRPDLEGVAARSFAETFSFPVSLALPPFFPFFAFSCLLTGIRDGHRHSPI